MFIQLLMIGKYFCDNILNFEFTTTRRKYKAALRIYQGFKSFHLILVILMIAWLGQVKMDICILLKRTKSLKDCNTLCQIELLSMSHDTLTFCIIALKRKRQGNAIQLFCKICIKH